VKPIGEGGFGVIHRASHAELGTVVYKELKSSVIADDSKFVDQTIHCVITVLNINQLSTAVVKQIQTACRKNCRKV